MSKSIICLFMFTFLFSSCKNEKDPFLINKNNIGFLTDSTQVKDLKITFPSDSIVNYEGDATFRIPMNMIDIYDKKGQLLLVLTPHKISDSTSIISNIRIEDSRYHTDKGISKASTFKDIQEAYAVSKIDNLINSIVVSVNELNAQFAIDKTELPASLRFDMKMNIESSQIPDKAKIKYFFINWN